MQHVCHIDFETRSVVDLPRCGTYVYVENKFTDALCCAYTLDDEVVRLWKLGESIPKDLKEYARNPDVTIAAHNANFEFLIWNFVCVPKYGWPALPLDRFDCTMARAYNMGLPGTLDQASKAVGLKAEKDMKGHRIMMQLCKPRSYTDGGTPIWWDPKDSTKDMDIQAKYDHLYRYCKQDVIVERELDKRLLQLSPTERQLWQLDQKINFRGITVDIPVAKRAMAVVNKEKKVLDKRMREFTGNVANTCNSHTDIKKWINLQGYKFDKGETGFDNEGIWDGDTLVVEGVGKDIINDLLENDDLSPEVRRVVELRKEAAKNSTAKLKRMLEGANKDQRIKGLFQYYGAMSTGRWAGRRIQTQNMPRPELKRYQINEIFDKFETEPDDQKARDYINLFYSAPTSAIADCLRGMLRASPGKKLVSADFSAIEGRVLAWLAGEESALNVYRSHGLMYEHTASQIYGVPIDQITKEDPRRLEGKVANLALGFQGGVGAFQSMAKNYFLKISDKRAEQIRDQWRAANPHIKQYWYDLERAAIAAAQSPGQKFGVGPRGRQVVFLRKGSFLFCMLPSGRPICFPYPKMKMVKTPWDEMKNALTYKGLVKKKFVRRVAYGGLLAENVTQATARDLLAEAMFRSESNNYPVIMHVHDELVTEVDQGFGSFKELEDIMSVVPKWAKDLPIQASGWEGERYRK